MATERELIYSIKEFLKDHTDDSLISNEHLFFQIKAFRNTLLRQLYSDRARKFDFTATQQFCMEMEVTDSGLCGAKTGCKIVRSVKKLPSLLSVKGRSALISVSPPIVGSKPYDIIDSEHIQDCLDDPYATNSAFVHDEYLYLVGNSPAISLVKCVSVVGIFENPEALKDYTTCESCGSSTKEACYTPDREFPLPGFLITPVIKEVLNEFLPVEKLKAFRDKDNDGEPV